MPENFRDLATVSSGDLAKSLKLPVIWAKCLVFGLRDLAKYLKVTK